MIRWIKEYFQLLSNNAKEIVWFELAYKLVASALMYPFVILLFKLVMKNARITYLTNEYIVKALLSPIAWISIIVMVVMFVLYCSFEMAYLSTCFQAKLQNVKCDFDDIMRTTYKHFMRIVSIKKSPLIFYYLLTIAAVNITIVFSCVLSNGNINNFNRYVIHGIWWYKWALLLAVILVYTFVFLGIYSFNIRIMEQINSIEAYKKSAKMVMKKPLKIVLAIVMYNTIIALIIFLFYVFITVILFVGVKIIDMAYMGSALYLSVLKYLRSIVKITLIFVSVPLSFTVVTRLYFSNDVDKKIKYEIYKYENKKDHDKHVIYKIIVVGAILLNAYYIINGFSDNSFDRIAIFHETKITAHRGASSEAPENTLSAFEMAIQNMSDYIEFDVRLTKDNQVVVMHDNSLYRTTGIDKKVSNLTLEEIKQIDVGGFYSLEFKGEKIPTLQEALNLIHGRAKVNIEIKKCGKDNLIVEKVMDILEKNNAINWCCLSSFEYDYLKAAKEIDPNIQVGYILSVGYGNYYNMKYIDFFSMNAAFVTKRTVDSIHDSGKQVYVWTVNNKTSIKNLTNKGVDNIITDQPILARETIYSRETSETIVNMAKYVFNR